MLEEKSQEDLSASSVTSHTKFSRERESFMSSLISLSAWCDICQRAKGLHGQHKHQFKTSQVLFSWIISSTMFQVPLRTSRFFLHQDHHPNVWCCHCSRSSSRSGSNQSSQTTNSSWSTDSLIVLFHAMVTQVL